MIGAKLLLYAFASYMVGSISPGYLIGKLFNKDVTKHGSGGTGATNVGRSLGKFGYAATLFLDVLKAWAVVKYCSNLFQADNGFALGYLVLLGNCYSIFLRRVAGKGVATGLGIVMAYDPLIALAGLAVFLCGCLVTRTVSKSSLAAIWTVAVLIVLTSSNLLSWITIIAVCVTITQRHEENIGRIRMGTEPKIGKKKEM